MRVSRPVRISRAQAEINSFVCLIITMIIAVGGLVYLYLQELEWKQRKLAYIQVEHQTIDLYTDIPNYYHVNKIVKVTSNNVTSDHILADYDFGLIMSNRTLRLKRVTQYCQWEEHSHTKNVSGHMEKTYYYTQGWHSHRINSLFFHNPTNHNPQRDPFPSHNWDTAGAFVGGFHVSNVFVGQMQSFRNIERFDNSDLAGFYQSPASTSSQFKPIGGGYFYSAYQAGVIEKILNVMNFQIGDLFSRCEAGDIRVHYEYVLPLGDVTVLGEQANEKGDLKEHITTRSYSVALMRQGNYNSHDLLSIDLKDFRWYLNIIRFIFGFVVTILVGILLKNAKSDQGRGAFIFFSGVFFTIAFLDLMWITLYGLTTSVLTWTFGLIVSFFASYNYLGVEWVQFLKIQFKPNQSETDQERAKQDSKSN